MKTKEEYTTEQIKRVLHNQQIILDMTRPHLENKDLNSNYEVLVELNRRVDTITGETPVIPKQFQLNDDDTECHITRDDRVNYITNTLQELIQEVKELNNDGK